MNPGHRARAGAPGRKRRTERSRRPRRTAGTCSTTTRCWTGSDITNPQESSESESGTPDVTFGFNSHGKSVFQQVTKEIAQRGQEAQLPGVSKEAAQQHFAIVLDGQVITAPSIDYTKYPEGIDSSQGSEISGGFTLTSAENLADELQSGALPIKLNLISQSQVSATLGKQALSQGLLAMPAGLRRSVPVPADLLPRARRDRDRRAADLRDLLLRADQADPDHADAAGDRRPDPDDRDRGGCEHRDLRARQGGDPRRALDRLGHRHRLPARVRGDRRRERGDVHDRVHPVRARHRGSQGLRLHARDRHAA